MNGSVQITEFDNADSVPKGSKQLEDIPEVAEENDISSPGNSGNGALPNGNALPAIGGHNNNDGSPPLPPKEKDLVEAIANQIAKHAVAASTAVANQQQQQQQQQQPAHKLKQPAVAPLAQMESDNIAGSRPCSIAVPNVAGASPNLSTISEEAAPLTLSLASSRFVAAGDDAAPLMTTSSSSPSSSSASNRLGGVGSGVGNGGHFPAVMNSSTPLKSADSSSFAAASGLSPGQLPLPPVSPLSVRDFPADEDVDAAIDARNRAVSDPASSSSAAGVAPALPPKESTLVLAEPQTHQPKKNSSKAPSPPRA